MTPEQLAEIEARAAVLRYVPITEPCPVCGNPKATCKHKMKDAIAGGFRHIWDCPDCGPSAPFVGYDCPMCQLNDQSVDIPALCAEVRRLQDGITKIEARWRAASKDAIFRSHYRGTMAECADELHDLLVGSVDEDALRAEINKTLDEDEPLTRDQMPWFRENMR